MEKKLFVDTWGWVVIHNKREPRHAEVTRFYRNFRLQKGQIYTTDYVLDETITLLFRRLPSGSARQRSRSAFLINPLRKDISNWNGSLRKTFRKPNGFA